MKHARQQLDNNVERAIELFRGAIHHAAAHPLPQAPSAKQLQEYSSRKRRRHVSRMVMTWTLGPALAAMLVIGMVVRPRPASQPAASTYASDSALLEQVNEDLSQTAPDSLQPLYGPSDGSATSTTHENATNQKVTR